MNESPLVCQKCKLEKCLTEMDSPCPRCCWNVFEIGFHDLNDTPTDHASGVGINQHSGRQAPVFDTREDVPFQEAQRLFELVIKKGANCDWGTLTSEDETAASLLREMGEAVRVGLQGEFFRAQPFSSVQENLQPCRFFRPPADLARAGRYNPQGNAVLYISNSPRTAASEVQWETGPCVVYAQKFLVDAPSLRWIPFERSLQSRHPLLNAYLLLCESAPPREDVDSAYIPSHFLRSLAESFGVDAIGFPSVRRREDDEVFNLVVFGDAMDLIERQGSGLPFIQVVSNNG